ncbi:MAG: oligosaccharide flippase family protein [Candidatus Magnetominusculus sp. LBB02]|nr:oligosaccharide flippase family protein [Candidatus Magnetominusculus sp. LBB02]
MSKSPFKRFRGSQLARNTSWMLIGHGLKIAVQAAYFVMMARSLHAGGYGAFVGVCALTAIVAPFAGIGYGNILIKNVARNAASFSRYWGFSLIVLLVTGTALLFVVLAAAKIVLPDTIAFSLIVNIALADLFFSRIIDIAGQAFQAFQRIGRASVLQVLPVLLKLISIAGLSIFIELPTPLQWSYLYLISSVAGAVIAVYLVQRELGRPVFLLRGMMTEMREGFYFSISLAAQNVYNDIDKTMLTRLDSLSAVGIYGAAYRVIEVSFTPVRSLLYAAYARFFQHGQEGVKGSLSFAKRLFPVAGAYGLVVGIALICTAPLLPYVLGVEYVNAAHALRWLSPLPFLKAVHYFTADTLTGAGFQGVRSGIQAAIALFNVGINLWLIPVYSWRGAAWASIASDGLLAVLLLTALFVITNKKHISCAARA